MFFLGKPVNQPDRKHKGYRDIWWHNQRFLHSRIRPEACGVYISSCAGRTFFFVFFPIPFFIFALLFSLPPSRNSDPGSHSRLFSPLTTTVTAYYGTCLAFYREKESTLSSLVDSIVPTHAVIGVLDSSWCHLRSKNSISY